MNIPSERTKDFRGFSRRRFLMSAAIVGSPLLASLPAQGGTAQAPRIGCGTVTFRKQPLEEALERIARAGYEYVKPQATRLGGQK